MMTKKLFLICTFLCLLPVQAFPAVSSDWEKHVIAEQSSPIYIYVKDMDNDGDLDIASTTNRHPLKWDSEVAWFRNNLDQGDPWEKFIISSSAPEDDPITNTNGIIISDIDGDGLQDIAVGTGRVTATIGSVYWFKAPEDPSETWQKFDVEVDATNSFFKIYTMDVNNDGMQDIIAGGKNIAVIFANPGNPAQAGAQWEKIIMPEGTGSALYLDDLNGDGKTDIINSFLHGNVSWMDVDYADGEVIFNRIIIDDDYENAFDVNCMYVNWDLKKDVLVSSLNTPGLYWYEAPAKAGNPWIKHTVSDTYDGTDIYTGEINGDMKTDFVVSGAFIDKISWFEYKYKNGEAGWTEHVIDDDFDDPGDVSLDDLDGDGDLDVVVAGLQEDHMVWYENKISRTKLCPIEFLLGEDSPSTSALRTIRDKHLMDIPGGKLLVELYYSHSQEIVGFLRSVKNLLNTCLNK